MQIFNVMIQCYSAMCVLFYYYWPIQCVMQCVMQYYCVLWSLSMSNEIQIEKYKLNINGLVIMSCLLNEI